MSALNPNSPPQSVPAGPTVAVALRSGAPTLADLFEVEEGALLGFAIGLTGRRSIAEELVQEAFLRLHPIWEQVENPKAWLYRTVRNLGLNHLRDHGRETLVEEPEQTDYERPPDEEVGRLETLGMVRMLVADLEPEARTLLKLKYEENLKYQEISQRTGISVGNVGYKLHHLLKGLADSLRHAGIDGSRG